MEQLSSNSENFLTVIERSYNVCMMSCIIIMFIENSTSALGFLQATAQRVELQPDSTAGVNVTVTPDCGK